MTDDGAERGFERKSAWIVDLDGTLAVRGDRDAFDWRRVGEDQPNLAVVIAVQAIALHPAVDVILAISGRDERSRLATEIWMRSQNVPFEELIMRPAHDVRPDHIMKEHLYRDRIEPRYSVVGVLDDRDQVVAMWRRIGLPCFQVAAGDFCAGWFWIANPVEAGPAPRLRQPSPRRLAMMPTAGKRQRE